MRFSSLLKPNLTALTKLTVVGLAACAVAIWIQWLSGDPAYPKFPPGLVFFVVVAVFVALGSRWWWTPVLGALEAQQLSRHRSGILRPASSSAHYYSSSRCWRPTLPDSLQRCKTIAVRATVKAAWSKPF